MIERGKKSSSHVKTRGDEWEENMKFLVKIKRQGEGPVGGVNFLLEVDAEWKGVKVAGSKRYKGE